MDLDIGDKVFYTRSIGCSDEGYVELEYHQDGVRVVNHRCPMDAVSFGIPSWDSPPPSPSSPPANHIPCDASGGSPLRGRSPLRTSSPSPSCSHATQSVFCCILRNFAFAGKSLNPPYGLWEHAPPHVWTDQSNASATQDEAEDEAEVCVLCCLKRFTNRCL